MDNALEDNHDDQHLRRAEVSIRLLMDNALEVCPFAPNDIWNISFNPTFNG